MSCMNTSPQSKNILKPGQVYRTPTLFEILSSGCTLVSLRSDSHPTWMQPMGYNQKANEAIGKQKKL